jgi:hypothetical protein
MSDPWTPTMPEPGTVTADLPTLKAYVGARSDQDDPLLEARLIVAQEHVYTRTMQSRWSHNDVQEAILLTASRLYKRRQSPEGVVGFGGEGGVVRIVAGDPDINDLLERHLDMANSGIA